MSKKKDNLSKMKTSANGLMFIGLCGCLIAVFDLFVAQPEDFREDAARIIILFELAVIGYLTHKIYVILSSLPKESPLKTSLLKVGNLEKLFILIVILTVLSFLVSVFFRVLG